MGRLWLPLAAAHLALLVIFDFGHRPLAFFAVLALAFAAFLRAVPALEKKEGLRLPDVLLVAALLRLLLIPLPPALSEDTLRYLWDGRVAAAGFDPYALPPEAAELAGLRDPLWQVMPHQKVPTVYPPLALGLFAAASRLPEPLSSLKTLLSLLDLIGCAWLFRLAVQLGLPPARSLFYAWNPLVVLEVAGMGHVDALMAMLSIAAVLLLARGKSAGAAAAAVAAVAAKLLPILALPAWTRRSPRPFVFGAVAGVLLLAVFLPLAIAEGGLPPGLRIYGQTWEFNGPLFEPLWRLIDAGGLAPRVKAGLDGLKGLTGWQESLDALYPFVYPQLIAKALLALGLLVFLARLGWRPPAPAIAIGRALAGLLVASSTVYPWYLVGLLPWAALCRRRAWLLASLLMPLAYLPRFWPSLHLFPWIHLLIWLPVFGLLLRDENWSID